MKIVMKVPELAQMLGVSEDSVYRAVRLGQLPNRRLGRRIVFHRPSIEAWLASGGSALEESPENKTNKR